MSRLGPYEVHPFADVFPLVTGEAFEDLVQSVKVHGLREPIVLDHTGKILVDGRNRWRACEAAGADPVFEKLPSRYSEQMILDLILDKNLHRRQLTTGQRAVIGLDYEERFSQLSKERQRASGRDYGRGQSRKVERDPAQPNASARQASAVVGTSPDAVKRAKAIRRDAPDLLDQVQSGALALDAADRERKKRQRNKPKPEPAPKPAQTMLTLYTHKGAPVEYPKPKGPAKFNESTGDGISWASWSWNPVTGCIHGCDYCYAREIATADRYKAAYPAGFTPLFHHERLDAPANTRIPDRFRDDAHQTTDHEDPSEIGACPVCAYRRVFVCSMADLYGRWVPDEWIDQVHQSMINSPQWQYILLTKFPQRYVGLDMPPGAWVGTSVDEQKRVRIAEDAFRKIDNVAVKWLSLEPLREPLEFSDLSMFDWVVIGAQTETWQPDGHVPAFSPPFEWIAWIVLQAKEAGCSVHLKPNLLTGPGLELLNEYPEITKELP